MPHSATDLVRASSLALLVALLGSCVGVAAPVADPDDIHIIVVMPFTGSFRSRSEVHRAAIQMAFRDLEAEGPIVAGRRIRAWEVDSTSNADECERRVRELVQTTLTGPDGRPMVAAMISTTTPAYTGSLRVALELRVPHFEISSGSHFDEFISREDHTDDWDEYTSYAFSTRPLCLEEARMTADFLASRSDWQRIFLMRGTKVHDVTHTQVIRARLALLADPANVDHPDNPEHLQWTGEIVNAEDYVMEYGSNWSEHLAVVESAGVDAFFFHLNGDNENSDFLEQAEEADVSPAIVTCNMAQKQELLDPVNPGIGEWLAGRLWFVGRRPLGSTDAEEDQFEADFQAFSGLGADAWTAGAYDAAFLIGLALATPGAAQGGTSLRDAIRQVASEGTAVGYGNRRLALELARAGMDLDYHGVSGPLDFRSEQTVLGEFMVNEVRWDTASSSGSYKTLTTPAPRQL